MTQGVQLTYIFELSSFLPERREIALEGKNEQRKNEQRRNTPNAQSVRPINSWVPSVGRIASLLKKKPFFRFDGNYGFLALSAAVWTMGKMRDGAQWLSNHYAANDYYCENEKVVGTWVGKGAEIFGIEGRSIEPQDEAFLAIFSGKTPSGEKLKQRDSGHHRVRLPMFGTEERVDHGNPGR